MKLFLVFLLLSVRLVAAVNVSKFATAGNGTAASPWVGWDTAITWVGYTQYNFSCSGAGDAGLCYFAFANSPNFLQPGIALIGEEGVVLKHTGSGNGMIFDNPNSWTDPGARMENLRIFGNPSTNIVVLVRGMRNGVFRNLTIGAGRVGLRSEACVSNTLADVRIYQTVNALEIGTRATNAVDVSTLWTISNATIEFNTGLGIWFQPGVWNNTIIGGTVESNQGRGMLIEGFWNTLMSMDVENNVGLDIEIKNESNTLLNFVNDGDLNITGGSRNRIVGGRYKNIYIHPYVHLTMLEGIQWTGVLNDQDDKASTIRIGNVGPGSTGGYQFNARFPGTIDNLIPLQHGVVVNTNAALGSNFQFFAYENFTLANPTNAVDGQKIVWRIGQGNAGGWIITYGSKFRVKLGGAFPVLSVPSNSYDYLTAIYNSQRDTWDIQ